MGRRDFIEPNVLEDAVEGAQERESVLVPSLEHLVVMKAEARFDRTGPQERKYTQDLSALREWMEREKENLDRGEIGRLVAMRPERKHDDLRRTIERMFEDVLQG